MHQPGNRGLARRNGQATSWLRPATVCPQEVPTHLLLHDCLKLLRQPALAAGQNLKHARHRPAAAAGARAAGREEGVRAAGCRASHICRKGGVGWCSQEC